eukprot:Gb_19034 [translate_table: standard]
MGHEYLVVHPDNGGILELLFFLLVRKRHGFIECPEHIRPRQMDQRWAIEFSILVRKFLKFVAKPMAWVGICIEFILNLLSNNGGIIGILFKILKGEGINIPKRNTETFISAIGHLDGRLDLEELELNDAVNGRGLNVDVGSRYMADVCVMASKLAYENEFVIRNAVTERWKMHFVEFFNCWNKFLEKKSTQAFIFCDRAPNAKLVVIAFRGTEPFDADDWSTDFDLSLYKIDPIGSVHLGFLEAMGLADRSHKQSIENHLNPIGNANEYSSGRPPDVQEDDEKPLAYYAIRDKLEKLLEEHKDAKFVVTGHSLGGALAILFPAILLLHQKKPLLERLLGVYTFGQPRVGDQEMGNFMNTNLNEPIPRYFRVVYCNDIIPRLPYDNKMFMFKHFGVCLYYNSCYKLKIVEEEPNRNFSVLYFIPNLINAIWELVQSLIIRYTKGEAFKESWFSIFFSCLGLFLPGFSAHSPVNYVNAVRLGPSLLNARLRKVDGHSDIRRQMRHED